MKKYKLHTGLKPIKLTDKQIMKHQNFDHLFMSYNDLTSRKKPPIYKSKKWFLFLLLVALASYLISEFS
jgi:hypothetical protein